MVRLDVIDAKLMLTLISNLLMKVAKQFAIFAYLTMMFLQDTYVT